jgi:hypothetical protein
VNYLKSRVVFDPVLLQLQLQTHAVETTQTMGAYCFLNSNGTVYDLNPLYRKNDDYNKTFPNADILAVNMCSKANKNCLNRTSLSTYTTKALNQCIALSGDEKAFTNYTIDFDNVTNITSLKAILPPGDACKKNTSTTYQMVYNLVCNVNQSVPLFDASSFDINKCTNEVTITTKEACPQFNIYGLWKALMENKYAFGSILLVLGLIMAYAGNKFLIFTEIMTGVILTLFLTLYFIMSNITFSLAVWQFWLIIGLCCALGALAGYFISKVTNLAAVILAGIVGYILGELAYTIALKYVQTNPTIVYWCVIVFSVVACALIGYWLADQIIIVVTAIIGAYGVMRGAAFILGYYPDEKQLYQLMNNKEWEQVNKMFTWHVYVYFTFFLIVAISGMYIQCKYFNESDEEKRKREDDNKEKLMMSNNQQGSIQHK